MNTLQQRQTEALGEADACNARGEFRLAGGLLLEAAFYAETPRQALDLHLLRADFYSEKGWLPNAVQAYRHATEAAQDIDTLTEAETFFRMADFFAKKGRFDNGVHVLSDTLNRLAFCDPADTAIKSLKKRARQTRFVWAMIDENSSLKPDVTRQHRLNHAAHRIGQGIAALNPL